MLLVFVQSINENITLNNGKDCMISMYIWKTDAVFILKTYRDGARSQHLWVFHLVLDTSTESKKRAHHLGVLKKYNKLNNYWCARKLKVLNHCKTNYQCTINSIMNIQLNIHKFYHFWLDDWENFSQILVDQVLTFSGHSLIRDDRACGVQQLLDLLLL